MATRRTRGGVNNASSGTTSFLHRGPEGRDRMEREVAAAKKRREEGGGNLPFRFYVKVDETKEFVVLDEAPDVFGYEHNLKNPRTGKWTENVTCVGEGETCQACEQVSEPTYVMYLSILDLSGYTDKRGNEVPFTRKLLVVKPTQQKKFARQYEREGSLRGAIFETSRDSVKEAAIGGDINFIEYMEEDELVNDYIREWEDREGKKHTENCGEPFDYDKVIAPPDPKAISLLLGDYEVSGSSRANRRALEEDEVGSKFQSDDGGDTVWEEDEESETPPRRGRRSSRAEAQEPPERESPRRGSRRSTRAAPEEQEEKPAASSRSSRRTTRSSSTGDRTGSSSRGNRGSASSRRSR